MDLRPGDKVFGQSTDFKYDIIEPCGNGQFGVVFKIKDSQSIFFALKTVNTAWLDPQSLKVLQNEGNFATQIIHENALRVYYFHDGNTYKELPPYMIMDFADGGTLMDLISERKSSKKMFTNEELIEMFHDLSSGMKAINEKMVHRDIKPDNILLSGGVLKISDFGLSKAVGAATRSSTFKGINHIRYCAPEAWSLESNTIAMDMYSMGIVFYELATLMHPYESPMTGNIVDAWKQAHLTKIPEKPCTHNKSLSDGLDQLIMKMISKRPQDRYATWDELLSRIGNETGPEKISFDVSKLVSKAEKSHFTTEEERIKNEKESNRRKELEAIIIHCFSEIIGLVNNVVETFNSKSEFIKLTAQLDGKNSIKIIGPKGKVDIFVYPVYENLFLHDNQIQAWGYIRSTSTKSGFNIILVVDDINVS